uniref:Uncharacterized protein n=1 Tax=Myotis myotis TaxID=51298 RepID=A0A7J7UQ99_MYOMY|nr:hypothetical protein mMyoMyo1_008705 [Myotis myotis]
MLVLNTRVELASAGFGAHQYLPVHMLFLKLTGSVLMLSEAGTAYVGFGPVGRDSGADQWQTLSAPAFSNLLGATSYSQCVAASGVIGCMREGPGSTPRMAFFSIMSRGRSPKVPRHLENSFSLLAGC